ncbi:MAG: YceI family protein [Candidatus Koribacter versatilis]|uniref:YceI family protein n=1 Tax=Candidatus Korobacter versatilis TaxID=658062 RepID=A0A932A7S5_9BACT|nr:YceI family protein [Candidatus Koribacter versatilis]
MNNRKALLLAALVALAALAFADEYKIDQAHSQVGFTTKHLMISNVNGRFTDFAGTITYDPKGVTKSAVNVSIKTPSITTDNAGRDEDLRNSEFMDVAKFPEMTFASKKVEKRGSQLVLIGDLTIKGVTKQVEIPFELNGPITDPWGNTRIAAEGSTTINRRDYGVTYNRMMKDGAAVVADKVKITLNVEGVKAKAK